MVLRPSPIRSRCAPSRARSGKTTPTHVATWGDARLLSGCPAVAAPRLHSHGECNRGAATAGQPESSRASPHVATWVGVVFPDRARDGAHRDRIGDGRSTIIYFGAAGHERF